MRTTWSFRAPAQLTFGAGAARQVGDWIARSKSRRALLICDRNLTAAGLTQRVHDSLLAAGVQVGLFSDCCK